MVGLAMASSEFDREHILIPLFGFRRSRHGVEATVIACNQKPNKHFILDIFFFSHAIVIEYRSRTPYGGVDKDATCVQGRRQEAVEDGHVGAPGERLAACNLAKSGHGIVLSADAVVAVEV